MSGNFLPPFTNDEDDADYQLALRLSAELNGGSDAPPTNDSHAQPSFDDADFALAVQLQFENSNEAPFSDDYATGHHNGGGASEPSSIFAEPNAWNPEQAKQKMATYTPGPTDGIMFRSRADFIAQMRSFRCKKCNATFFRSALDVSRMIQAWMSGKSQLSSLLRCRSCSDSSCIACRQGPNSKPSTISFAGRQASWCCAGGRVLVLWLLLCGFDEQFSTNKLKDAKPGKSTPVPIPSRGRGKSHTSTRGGGVGFGGAYYDPMGMGFDEDDDYYVSLGIDGHTLSGHPPNAHRSGHKLNHANGKAKALSAQQNADTTYATYMGLIEGLLPSFERDTSFDFDPPDLVAELLIESKILSYCAELLRNDSIEDATRRKDIYLTLINILRTLGAHYVTANRTLYAQRLLREDKINLLVSSFSHVASVNKETGGPLFDSLRNLNIQSELVLQNARRNERDFRGRDGQNMLVLCRQITDLYKYLEANADSSANAASKAKTIEIPAMLELPDDQMMATHSFAAAANALCSAPSGRFKRLVTEITSLKTSLPPGIFVRYAESRPDVQKAIIIGPAGTPYENGMFEFDIFCDGSFPNKPPKVHFKTTGGGRVGFNPNLYPDGKVCLSLLGTWQGEPWNPGESTLLQVLISIQAMILCEEPWYNEPGREAAYHRNVGGPSESYNRNIRQHTMRTAMLDWLDRTPPLWKDLVEHHFKENGDKILQTIETWSKSNLPAAGNPHSIPMEAHSFFRGRGAPSEDFDGVLSRLQTALRKFGATYTVKISPPPAQQKESISQRPGRASNVAPQQASQPLPSMQSMFSAPPPPGYMSPHPSVAPTQSSYNFSGFGNYPEQGNYPGQGYVFGGGDGGGGQTAFASLANPAATSASMAGNGRGGHVLGGGGSGYNLRSSTVHGRGGSTTAPAQSNPYGAPPGGPATPGRGGYGFGRGGRGGRGGHYPWS